MPISDFHELQLPQADLSNGDMQWTVRIKASLPYYLVNDGSYTLGDLLANPDSLFYFKSAHEAHRHACEYYTNHKEIYPYFDEYSHAMIVAKLPDDTDDVNDNDNYSQVMTF